MVETNEGPFWEALDGRRPLPRIAQTLGFKLRSWDDELGEIEIGFTVGEEFTNPVGNVQGGIIAAMLDDTLGPAMVASLPSGDFAPTLELKVSFLRPAKPGGFVGRGRVLHRGGTVAFLAGELHDEEGVLLATASSTVRIVRGGWHPE
ncbi:MAG: phenylacetic acid degradation-related protein [Marmoricola sp.]|nr:phenylacetic acid degradation-related protein [Marmoricola sp.]